VLKFDYVFAIIVTLLFHSE